MTTAVSFIFVLGVLIFIHELGHFLVAKWAGIRVERFSLGFPPNIFAKQYGDTTYCIGMIPLGGYVKMAGDNPAENVQGAPDEFASKSIPQRAAVIFAGPFMNYVLAILLLIGIYMFGGRPVVDENNIVVGQVTEDGPAAEAGLGVGDTIIALNGQTLTNFDSLRLQIYEVVDAPLELTWVKGTDTVTREITTKATPIPTPEGTMDTVGMIGFSQQIARWESYGVGESVSQGFVMAHVMVYETVMFVKRVVSGEVSAKMIGGPLFIAQQSGREARKGAASLFLFMALLSVNLAVINVLPIPILDGGQLVLLAVEKLRGGPLSVKVIARAQQVGLVVLLSLIVFVTYNDIVRAIRGF